MTPRPREPIADDEALVSRFLSEAAADPLDDAPLPPPGAIWFRAQAMQRRRAAERAVAAIQVARSAALLLAVAFTVALIVWQAPHVATSFPQAVSAGLVALLAIGSAAIAYASRGLLGGRNPRRGI